MIVLPALILLDSSAILNDYGFCFDPKRNYAMTSRIATELKDLRSRMMVDNALMLRLLSITDPCPLSLQWINDFVAKKGFEKLSAADLSLLALARELRANKEKIVLVSDDYSIQNMCKELKIPFKSVIQGRIKETIVFNKRCPACGKKYARNYRGRECENCGTQLRVERKPGKRPKNKKQA